MELRVKKKTLTDSMNLLKRLLHFILKGEKKWIEFVFKGGLNQSFSGELLLAAAVIVVVLFYWFGLKTAATNFLFGDNFIVSLTLKLFQFDFLYSPALWLHLFYTFICMFVYMNVSYSMIICMYVQMFVCCMLKQ